MPSFDLRDSEAEEFMKPTNIPNITFKTRQLGQWVDVSTDQLFKG